MNTLLADLRVGAQAALKRQGLHDHRRADAGRLHRSERRALFGDPWRAAQAARDAGCRASRDGRQCLPWGRVFTSRWVRRFRTTSIGCVTSRAFAEQAVFKRNDRSVDQGGTPVSVEAMTVTPSFFKVAGVDPQLGRTFIDQKGEAGDEFEVVISDSFWRNHFGGEASVVGRSLRLDGRPYIVIGVMPRGFNPTDDSIELWTPMSFTPKEKSDEARHSNTVAVLRTSQAGRDASTGAGSDRLAERRQPRSIPRVQGSSRQRRVSHRRESPAGPDGQGRESHALSDVGRLALRASDRLRQRREPGTRPVARPAEGARDAPGARRGHRASRPATSR